MEDFYVIWENILMNFNFDKVVRTMEALNWTWYDEDYIDRQVVIKHAKKMIKEAYNKKQSVASGGFYAIYIPKEENVNDIEAIELKFVVESWVGERCEE